MATPISGINPQSAVFLAAHTAPFKEPSSWGGILPRIPDGHEFSTQVQQVRIQGSMVTDSAGSFHLVVPGDPYRNRFPYLTHDMNMRTGDYVNNTYVSPASAPGIPVFYSAPTTDMPTVSSRVSFLAGLLCRAAATYTNTLPTYIQQLSSLVADNAAYRCIGQASRIWSLQGELQPQTGIIRVATISNAKFNECTELRGCLGVADVYAVNNKATDLNITNAQSYNYPLPYQTQGFAFPAFCTNSPIGAPGPNEAPINTAYTQNQDSVYGGLMYQLGADVANGYTGNPYSTGTTSSPPGNPLWQQYLKQVAEAAEHAFSYVIFDGRKGATARSAYNKLSIPFRTFRPYTLFNSGAPKGPYPQGANFQGPIQSGGSSFSIGIPLPNTNAVGSTNATYTGSGMYTYIMGNNVEPLAAAACQIGGGTGAITSVGVVANMPGYPNSVQPCLTGVTQITALGGQYDILNGFQDANTAEEPIFDGYHIYGTQFLPNTTMYFEHVLTIETVPNQQQTGLMSIKPILDMDFHKVLEMASHRDAFPRVAMGHSFWSSFVGAIKKGASAVWSHVKNASNVIGSVASMVPGPIGMAARVATGVTGAFSDNADYDDY